MLIRDSEFFVGPNHFSMKLMGADQFSNRSGPIIFDFIYSLRLKDKDEGTDNGISRFIKPASENRWESLIF